MHNIATTNPKLLSWFASENPLSVFFKILPIVGVLVYFILRNFGWSTAHFVCFLLGLFTWSLFEYVVHRWVYHVKLNNENLRWFLESFHIYHHQKMDDHHVLNAGFFLIYPLFLVFFGIVFVLTEDLPQTSSFCLGLIFYYFFYENVHYFLHYKTFKSGYFHFIQKYHLYHHYKNWKSNFGNTTSFWDRVFGTYDVRYKEFSLGTIEKSHLISKK